LSGIAFLAGSGISVDSGLPTARTFNKALARHFCSTKVSRIHLRRLLITDPNAEPEKQLRFERVIQVLRDTVDPELSILDVFGSCVRPTFLHWFLARAIQAGSPVFTTNFDSLIEAAYLARSLLFRRQVGRLGLTQVIYETCPASARDRPFIESFASWLRGPVSAPALFKLHGSVHDIGWLLDPRRCDETTIDSVNATLDSIGNRRRVWSLEPYKARVLELQLKDRLLVTLGYSGLDDFDIIPSLVRLLPQTRGLVFVSHRECGNVYIKRVDRSSADLSLPRELSPALDCGVPIWVIYGPTAAVVRAVFGDCTSAIGPALGVTTNLFMNIPTYKQLPRAERRRVVARLLEESGELDRALREYRVAIKRLSRLPHLRSALAYCYNRFGAIQWRRGSYSSAILSMRRAETLNRNLRNEKGIASVRNNLGYVFMSMGDFTTAKKYFQQSYKLHMKLSDRAAMARNLRNLGIVARRHGRIDDAYRQFRRSLALSTGARDLEGISQDLGNLGNVELAKKRYHRAMKMYFKSYKLSRQLGMRETMAIQLGNMGIAQRHLNRFSEALRYFRQALRINHQLGRTEGIMENVGNIGAVLGDLGRHTKGLREFDFAIALARKMGEREGLAVNYEMKGELLRTMGELNLARAALRASLRNYRKLGHKRKSRDIAIALRSIADR